MRQNEGEGSLFRLKMNYQYRVAGLRRAIGVTAIGWMACLLEIVWWRNRSVPPLMAPPQMAFPLPRSSVDIWLLILILLTAVLVVELVVLAVFEVVRYRVDRLIKRRELRV